MKKSWNLFFAALCLLIAFAAIGDEKIVMTVGDSKTVQLPFVLKSYRILPAGSKIIKVEELDSHLRVIAGAIGEASLVVNGITGDQRIYAVSVKSKLTTVLRKLRNDLDNLSELDISINEDKIVIRGTVTDPEHWAHLIRVLPMYEKCVSFASFAPSAESLLDLKKRLEDAGFKFAANQKKQRQGELFLSSNKDTVFLSGELFSNESISRVNQILATAPLMSGAPVKKVVNITLAQTFLEVNIAFMSLRDADNFTRTGNINPTGTFDASFLRRWLDNHSRAKTIAFGTDMNGTLSLLQSNFITKVLEQGVVTFANGGEGSYNFGGTIKVPVSGTDTGDLKDVTYGYNVKVSGGLSSEREARLKLDLNQNDVGTDAKGNYDQQQNQVSMTLPLELNKTYLVAHYKKQTEKSSESATPLLGRIPVIKWFFSDSGNRTDLVNLLVLVSVAVKTTTVDAVKVDSQGVLENMRQPTNELIQKPGTLSKDMDNILR